MENNKKHIFGHVTKQADEIRINFMNYFFGGVRLVW